MLELRHKQGRGLLAHMLRDLREQLFEVCEEIQLTDAVKIPKKKKKDTHTNNASKHAPTELKPKSWSQLFVQIIFPTRSST
jgi:hypothetical protein